MHSEATSVCRGKEIKSSRVIEEAWNVLQCLGCESIKVCVVETSTDFKSPRETHFPTVQFRNVPTLRIELSVTALSGPSGQPVLDYRISRAFGIAENEMTSSSSGESLHTMTVSTTRALLKTASNSPSACVTLRDNGEFSGGHSPVHFNTSLGSNLQHKPVPLLRMRFRVYKCTSI